uniref:Putative transcriptional regulator n=1 Tax=Desulfovibrio sp. U5L TaxID=596152 RepID=I2PZ27_9BACT
MSNLHEILGKRIQSFRKKKGLTQLQLAEMANLSLKHLGEIERGRGNPTLESLYNLCNSLDITLKNLFDLEMEELSADDIEKRTLDILQSLSKSKKSKMLRILSILIE